MIDSLDSETTITIITTWKAEENVDRVRVIVDSENEIIEIVEEDNTMSVGIDVAYGWGMGWVEQARQNPLTLILVIIALIVVPVVTFVSVRQMNNSGYDEDMTDMLFDEEEYEDEEYDDYDDDEDEDDDGWE